MTNDSANADAPIDLIFPVDGSSLPRDHAQALLHALCAHAPWLGNDERVGIHPIRLVPGVEATALLSRRTRLLLRLRPDQAQALAVLAGQILDVAGHALRLGAPLQRSMEPHATLYAYRVAADSADELAFMAAATRELAALCIGGERVCGKHQQLTGPGRTLDTFSLMLHGLKPEQSLHLQYGGLGPHRLLGCGIFVPHKSAAAV